MSKGRLEDARDIRNYIDGQGSFDKDVEVMDWLIAQAKRVQELEEDYKELNNLYIESCRTEWLLEQQNKRYREAIENTQVAIQKNISRWNYKDEVVLRDVFIHNKNLLEGESDE